MSQNKFALESGRMLLEWVYMDIWGMVTYGVVVCLCCHATRCGETAAMVSSTSKPGSVFTSLASFDATRCGETAAWESDSSSTWPAELTHRLSVRSFVVTKLPAWESGFHQRQPVPLGSIVQAWTPGAEQVARATRAFFIIDMIWRNRFARLCGVVVAVRVAGVSAEH